MTQSKREPFAKATKHPTLDTWLVADAAGNNLCWADDSQAWEQWDAESRANSINAAFNARVDEEVRKAVAERDARIAELEKALEPFADPDLSEVLSGNCKGDDSPVFQRDKAMLLIGHFRKARKALGKGE